MTPTAPFDPTESAAATHLVLADGHGNRSLWPGHIAVPAGWLTVHGPASYAACLAHAEAAGN
ncbi:MbtH family NRPS accessory protein [Streptomyces celluloflavus]|uniref:MbtH family NRPS accessory protein n=1 Tax=Streptomyces celluloflavus TaxID=58344 RepID=UPI00364EF52E